MNQINKNDQQAIDICQEQGRSQKQKQNKQSVLNPQSHQLKINWSNTKVIMAISFIFENTMQGVALLSLSFLNARLGIIISTLFSLISCIFACFSLVATTKNTQFLEAKSMLDIIKAGVKSKFVSYFLDVMILIGYFSFLVNYISVFADYLVVCLKSWGNITFDSIWIKLISLPIFFGLSCLQSPGFMSSISQVALILILFSIISTLAMFIIYKNKGYVDFYDGQQIIQKPLPQFKDLLWPYQQKAGYIILEAIQRFPVFPSLYSALPCVPNLAYDMETNARNWKTMVLNYGSLLGTIVTFIVCTFNGIIGSCIFGKDVNQNILLNFDPKLQIMTVSRFLYAIVVLCSFVVMIYPARRIVMNWAKKDMTTKSGRCLFYITGLIICIISVGLSILIPDIATFLNIVEAIAGTLGLRAIIPIIFIYIRPKIEAQSKVPYEDEPEDIFIADQVAGRISLAEHIINISQPQRKSSFTIKNLQQDVIDQINDLQQQNQDQVKNDVKQKENTINNESIQIANENNQNIDLPINDQSKNSEIDYDEQIESPEAQQRRQKQLQLMTKGRLVWAWLGGSILVVIGLISFVLSTFFSMDQYN